MDNFTRILDQRLSERAAAVRIERAREQESILHRMQALEARFGECSGPRSRAYSDASVRAASTHDLASFQATRSRNASDPPPAAVPQSQASTTETLTSLCRFLKDQALLSQDFQAAHCAIFLETLFERELITDMERLNQAGVWKRSGL